MTLRNSRPGRSFGRRDGDELKINNDAGPETDERFMLCHGLIIMQFGYFSGQTHADLVGWSENGYYCSGSSSN